MQSYSPFSKQIDNLAAEDLPVLRNVAEGWYVEYKQEVPNASSIAKSIAALANTYGGWLFYGIAEKSKDEPTAGSFPGIDATKVDAVLQQIRNAVAMLLSPVAHFEVKPVFGPYEPIGLPQGRAIVCIQVPWSPIAPHIHHKGLIYRRVADSSDPRPENDRFVVDQMLERSKLIVTRYAEWHDDDPFISGGEENKPYIRVMITPSLVHERHPRANLGLKTVRHILGQQKGEFSAVPFGHVYTTSAGYVGRQSEKSPEDLGLMWHLQHNLRSDVLIPMDYVETVDFETLELLMHGYDHSSRFVSMLRRQGFRRARVLDLNKLFTILAGVVEIQRRLHIEAGWSTDFFVKHKILNASRMPAFVDVESMMSEFEAYGVPMLYENKVTTPPGSSHETFVSIQAYSKVPDEVTQIIIQTSLVFLPICMAFGVDFGFEKNDDDVPAYCDELKASALRSIERSRQRREK
jgi:hypothetical protein